MKSIATSFAIFIVIIISILLSTSYLDKVCTKLQSLNIQIERDIDKNDWNKAYDNSIIFLKQWDNYSKKISVFVDHEEIDNINNELWKLTQYTKSKNKDESLASNHVVKFFLNHISDMEKINLQNIF